jgi:CheY-like chemotaxis protein
MIQRLYKLRLWTLATLMLCATTAWSQPAAKPPAPPAAISPNEQLELETNPAVRAALELPRTEPKHYVSAILALVDLGRPELAAPILKELQGLNLSDDQRAQLVNEFGSHRMLQLSLAAALAPAGQQFADACMAAAATQARDPQRLARLVTDLTNPSAEVRHAATVDLAAAGQDGANAALIALASETDPQRRSAISTAVVRMDGIAARPLMAMLTTNDPALKFDVMRILTSLQVAQALPLIEAEQSGPGSPFAARSEQMLLDALRSTRQHVPAFPSDENDHSELWQWDDATKQLSLMKLPADEVQTIWAARLALALAQLRPENAAYRRQALVLGLEAATLFAQEAQDPAAPKLAANPQFEQLVAAADATTLNNVLVDSLKGNYANAAIVASKLLAKRGDPGVLLYATPQPAPLAEALVYPDRRVRYAALSAIMALNPPSAFPGASRVPETLGFFATSASGRRAVVAMPIADQATTLAGQLTKFGIDAQPATRGAAAVRLATQSADLDMVLVDVDIDAPGVRDVVFSLRSSPATGQVPIGLLATSERMEAAKQIAAEHENVIAFVRPQNDEGVTRIIEQLGQLSAREQISPQDRAAMGAQALTWLGELLARNQTFYDLRRQSPVIEAALYQPDLAQRAIGALALLGTPEGQRALLDYASRSSVPLDSRQQAAAAFQKSVARSGILLTEEEILRQYDRYNASSTADADTQKVLGTILDTLESLRAKSISRRN